MSLLPPPPSSLGAHPRLILTEARLAEIRSSIASGGDAATFATFLKEHADWVITQPPVPRGKAGASGVLMQVRYSLDLLLTCAAQAAISGGIQHGNAYFERALLEANNLITNWTDWNTEQHALDTGEALLATALAYDWLYPGLSEAERDNLLQGIVRQGLTPYKKFIGTSTFWWMNNTINWNCVCSSGGVVATFALQGDSGAPSWVWDGIAAPLVEGVGPCVGAYHSDSSWEEGSSYWGYASKYNVLLFAALNNTLGSTLGLSNLPGVAHAARFPIYSTGAQAVVAPTTSSQFNWADAGEGYDWNPFTQWWSGAFGERAVGYFSRVGTLSVGPGTLKKFAWGGFVEALAFFDPQGLPSDIASLPQAASYPFINMGVVRGPWLAVKERQTYLAFKGGNSAWNHNHLDLGGFVYDVNGTRFACDMGADNYALPGYFDKSVRWRYYRLNSHGHNVVLFNNASQPFPATATITQFSPTGNPPPIDATATLDLTPAYSAHVRQATRSFTSYNDTRMIVVVDKFVYGDPPPSPTPLLNLTWQLHTRATPTTFMKHNVTLRALDGSLALLAYLPNQSTCPSFSGFSATDLGPLLPPPYDSAQGYTRLDALVLSPGLAGAQCTQLAFALGEVGLVTSLIL